MSAAADWSRVKLLFAQALDQPAAQRAAWITQACAGDAALEAELRSLLEAQAAPDRFGAADLSPLVADDADPDVNARVGPYRLLRLLGEGGMGRVFLADRADGQFQQHVALKLIRADFATAELRERFLRERDMLARLVHPNIAQLHDGGVNDAGLPYFTLEYIDGDRITDWCDARALGVAARIRLILKVCDAVQYAHRNLI